MIKNKLEFIWDKIKANKRIIFEFLLAFFFLLFLYQIMVSSNNNKESEKSKIIQEIKDNRAKNEQLLKEIKQSLDSIHVEQRNVIEKIDGTQNSIKKLEKQRNEKVKYVYTNNVDSTVSLLRDRYSKLP